MTILTVKKFISSNEPINEPIKTAISNIEFFVLTEIKKDNALTITEIAGLIEGKAQSLFLSSGVEKCWMKRSGTLKTRLL